MQAARRATEAAAALAERGKRLAQAAEDVGKQDKEMPAGTAVHVPGKGSGVVRGFTWHTFGANEFLIEFGGRTQPVKLKDAPGWRCEADPMQYTPPDLSKFAVPAALRSELEAAQKVSGCPPSNPYA